jgi:hypothetical protein
MKLKLSVVPTSKIAIVLLSAMALAANVRADGGDEPGFPGFPGFNNSNNLPVVTLVATDPTALEGTSTGAFTLLRHGPTNADLTVGLGISGTASNGVDYQTISNMITIPAGSLAVDIPVIPIIDNAVRGNKSVVLTVQSNANYVAFLRRAVVEIIDDTFNIPPPTVMITSPSNGSVFTNPVSITITATATDPDATIRSVSFFANDDFLGVSTNAPYSVTVSNLHAGFYALFARAVDNAGKSMLSAAVHITVTNDTPTVMITSPTNNSSFMAGTNITINATATDAGSAIVGVGFFANGHALGSSTTSPYSFTWTNVPGGFYSLEAVATNTVGTRGDAKPVFIKVNPVFKMMSILQESRN